VERKHRIKLVVGVVLASILASFLMSGCGAPAPGAAPAAPAGPTAEEPIVWRIQSFAAPADLKNVITPFVEDVEAMSNGRLQIELFSSTELVPDTDLLSAVKAGTIDATQWCAPLNPDLTATGIAETVVVYGLQNLYELHCLYEYKGVRELVAQSYADYGVQHVGTVLVDAANVLVTSKPIRTYEDLNGLNVVSFPAFSCPLEKAGVTFVDLPPDEMYLAGKTGVVDGAAYGGIAQMYALSLHEVFDWVLLESTADAMICQFVVNQDSWDALPADLQEIVRVANEAMSLEAGARKFIDESDGRLAWKNFTRFSPEDSAKLRAHRDECWAELHPTPEAQQLLQLMLQYEAELEATHWKRP
jgi:TRAP-type mannitol/chloroaromatic compound transport system substrate-binding protein